MGEISVFVLSDKEYCLKIQREQTQFLDLNFDRRKSWPNLYFRRSKAQKRETSKNVGDETRETLARKERQVLVAKDTEHGAHGIGHVDFEATWAKFVVFLEWIQKSQNNMRV